MTERNNIYQLIENQADMQSFLTENENIEWLGFDTEFIGEKRYHTLLCLVQIATENGYYLIDTLKLKSLEGITQLLENPNILKITHAGENDYRLFHRSLGTIPKNTFDTQIAAGFVGYKYPTSFQKLVDKELGVFVPKGYTVSDWEARPINKKQIQYALNDVLHLYDLWKNLHQKLDHLHRGSWAKEEFIKMEQEDFYRIDPYKEVFKNNLISSLNPQEQVFMIRLYDWRRQEAARKDYSKEMILPSKTISTIVRNITSGKNALKKDRRLPTALVNKHWETFSELFNKKITGEEREVLKSIPKNTGTDPQMNTMLEMLYLIVEFICQKQNIAPSLVLHRTAFKQMKAKPEFFETSIENGWRAKLLGKELLKWLRKRDELTIEMKDGKCIIEMKN